ncbi:GrpB family protein [Thalassotalea sediminis]|uniref:GrpB family protein n=1 Tax=Thalassotalea sediminis TaxID=1759089 RepID=UPI002572AF9F|nr:GrpB family protein [Thalassotalea sediminis]
MNENAVALVKYDPNWPSLFALEKAFLARVIKPWIFSSIEHVGSTSVVGLDAKPVIDIMVGVKSLQSSSGAIDVLTRNGYCYYPYKKEVMHWFCKPTPAFRTHHLHLVPFESALWHERINFRNCLRENPSIAKEYAHLKYKLAAQFKDDRERYTINKWPFIRKVLQAASQ